MLPPPHAAEEERDIGLSRPTSRAKRSLNVIAFIHITLADPFARQRQAVRTLVNAVDDIQEAYSLTGDADYR